MATCFVTSDVFSPNDNNATSTFNTENIIRINIKDKNRERIQNTQKNKRIKQWGKYVLKQNRNPPKYRYLTE